MPRITSRIDALIVAAALVSVAMFAAGRDAGAASTGYAIDIKISDDVYSVACDGVDSFRITTTVTLDGAPVRGAAVYAQSALAGHTNRHGVLRFDYAPPPQSAASSPRTNVLVRAVVGEVSVSQGLPRFFACPFPAGPYGLTLALFEDRDGDGVRGRHEAAFRGRDVLLGVGADTLQGSLPSRVYTSDRNGVVTASLHRGADGVRSAWILCLTQPQVRRGIRIVSVGGQPLPEIHDNCVYLVLVEGNNSFTVGVQRP